MDNTETSLAQASLRGLLSLYQFIKGRRKIETASCTIKPEFEASCNYMVQRSYELLGIIPKGLTLNESFQVVGDPGGMFCFGGSRLISGKWVQVNAAEHISLLAGLAQEFEQEHLIMLDRLAIIFALLPHMVRGHRRNIDT